MREDKILWEISEILGVSKEDIPKTIKRFKEDIKEN